MTARRICALALAAAACSSQKIGQSFELRTPVALVPFNGHTRYSTDLHPYVAVASMQGDELRIFDPLENRAVSSPGFAFALSVPTAPRPVLLASADLKDGGADLLVVASAGEQSLQLVDTWEGADSSTGMRVISSVDLSTVADPGTQILAMIGQPGTVAAPGRARILVAFSRAAGSPTARLVSVEFQRGTDGSVGQIGPPLAVALGFEAVSLSRVAEALQFLPGDPPTPVPPKYPHLVFAPTSDIVTGTDGRSARGVAMLDVSASDPALWTVTAVDAGAPTRLVAAAVVGERHADSTARVFGPAVLRVYADLDPAACGPAQAIACGIATMDPLANPPGLAAEIVATGSGGPVFVPNQSYRAPMALPGVSLAMAVATPPAQGGERSDRDAGGLYRDSKAPSDTNVIPYSTDDGAPLMRLAPKSGQRWTTAAMVVASSTGSSYVLDLGGSAAQDDVSLLILGTTKVQANNARVVGPQGYVASDATPALGLWDSEGSPTDTSLDVNIIARSIQVTPGFTRDDDWTLTWQGTIPGFALRPAVVGRSGGVVYVAFQTQLGDGRWFSDTDLADAAVGIHALDPANPAQEPGDIVEVSDLYGNSRCAVQQDTPVLGFLPSAPALPPTDPASFPGGALALGPTVPGCIDPGAADGAHYQALVSVRAFGLVLVGRNTGYAGRPVLDRTGPAGSAPPSALKWEDERPLVAACSPANRVACESLSVVRKARRFYYPLEPPCPEGDQNCTYKYDPLAPGPALAFRVGPYPASASGTIARGLYMVFSTLSGVSPMSQVPVAVSVPNAAISVDRSRNLDGTPSAHVDDGTWFYVSYTGNTVLGFGPGLFAGSAVSLR